MQNLTAPGMCASQLLALNTTALFNTPLTPMELMPALDYFTMDVAQLLRDYLGDSSITVQVPDFCAGDRISTPRFVNRTLVTVTLPTLYVAVNLLDATTPERLLPPFGLLGQLLRNCVWNAVLLAAAPVYWDSWLMLYEAASVNDLNVCGGQVFPVGAQACTPTSNYGPPLATLLVLDLDSDVRTKLVKQLADSAGLLI
ncbi:hypothetical protein QJQ45_010380 [Haematococcus lacustris]|nr:hypothetical protein QJQ45_010380 [Haematococcus lacustris]